MIKKHFHNLPFVANRKETIDFKTFCSGGSPEYVKAKQRLRDFHIKIEPPKFNLGGPKTNKKAYSLYINPLAFFDPTFFVIGAAVVVVAILEKQLASHGLIFVASAISGILRIAFPVVAAGSFFYLLTHVNFL
jgi:hypothetical protein